MSDIQEKIDVYKRLAEHLNHLPTGFPPTDSGVELRILKRLFTPEEAAIAPGTNTVYSNHDENNTTKFGTNRWWKTPSTITVKKRPQQGESTAPVKAAPSVSSTVR